MLDLLARTPLWAAGLDYRHGTGHGVGAHLCVHEGPHLISYYARDPDPPIKVRISALGSELKSVCHLEICFMAFVLAQFYFFRV